MDSAETLQTGTACVVKQYKNKISFLKIWAIRTVFAEPVTYVNAYPFSVNTSVDSQCVLLFTTLTINHV